MNTEPFDDPILLLRALAELTVSVLAMHMTPEALERGASTMRRVADEQEAVEAAGVAIHSANRAHDPALARMVADLYEHARVQGLEKLTREKPPTAGHEHRFSGGVATAPLSSG